MQWVKPFLVHQGMDGSNVNLVFQKRLQRHFRTQNFTFLDNDTSPLYAIHNGFSKGVSMISFDIKQFIVDINAFFKLCSACRKDYSELEGITELPPHFSLKHSST